MRFLLVDDNEQFRKYLREYLGRPGDEFHELDDGVGVNTAYAEFRPDWVLLDIQMKTVDGFTAGERLKREFPEARFLIVSSYSDARFVRRAQAIKADGFIAKENLQSLAALVR